MQNSQKLKAELETVMPSEPIEHSENRLLRISKTKLDLECFSLAFNKHAFCKSSGLQGQN